MPVTLSEASRIVNGPSLPQDFILDLILERRDRSVRVLNPNLFQVGATYDVLDVGFRKVASLLIAEIEPEFYILRTDTMPECIRAGMFLAIQRDTVV